MATIREVAALAGVSVATVSRLINRNGYVNKETEFKINKAIEELNYQPSSIARGLAGKRMDVVALVLPDINNPFFPELARAVEDICLSRGYTLILCNSDNDREKELNYIKSLSRNSVSGFIFATDSLSQEDLQELRQSGTPIVVLDRSGNADNCSIIRADSRKGAMMAVQHLLDKGRRKIAHIYGPQSIVTARERLEGYEQIAQQYDWYSPSLLIPGNFRLESGIEAVELLLERHPDVDGIFAGNDMMAIGALKGLIRRGIRVPEQIALCGFDGIGMTRMTEPELTTIAQPIAEMGKMAAEILIGKIESNGGENRFYELDVHLIERSST
ncbi:LacI family transcriptional regulator [Paenibacillus taihuensis]|uniref:LacI family transcriptional regulator n=1 Tax=Paenibacillus taihuensis TaxID=1156355 RepID=A0A3D9Q4H1_9BACL|nr:LacI family DNA-binding transcriptional regulator [Paenibacillus taihuensis]REE57580.1 LacI family transcriptional regulator [Paenibacillus taihuensis]